MKSPKELFKQIENAKKEFFDFFGAPYSEEPLSIINCEEWNIDDKDVVFMKDGRIYQFRYQVIYYNSGFALVNVYSPFGYREFLLLDNVYRNEKFTIDD